MFRKTSALSLPFYLLQCLIFGETNNVIPDTCKIGGTIRTFDSDTQNSVIEGFKKVLEGIATSTDVTYDLKYSKGYPPVINTERETDLILEATKEIDSVEELVELEASLGGEDFSYYQQRVPGAFFYTGTRNEHFKADFLITIQSLILMSKA